MTSTNTDGLNALLGGVLVRPKNPSVLMDSSNVGVNEKLKKNIDSKDDISSKISHTRDWNFILPSNVDKNSTTIFDLDTILPKMSIISKSFYSFCKFCSKDWSVSWFKKATHRKSSTNISNSQQDLSNEIKNRSTKKTRKNLHSSLKTNNHDITRILETAHVIIQSSSFCLLPVVSSVVKIMLDPFYRSIEGFWCLITEEWLSKKYKFNPSIENLNSYGFAYEPSLILFLSVVHNFSVENYMEFEYDTNFLLFISDLLPSGLFHSYQQSVPENIFISGLDPFKLMELWNTFRNPLYYKNLSLKEVLLPLT
ncbi:hypothetical protein MXB_1368 [Myxobolus squamalis]|nr:hypothetical protein MXB_1368 [Myxobolus squamalis]